MLVMTYCASCVAFYWCFVRAIDEYASWNASVELQARNSLSNNILSTAHWSGSSPFKSDCNYKRVEFNTYMCTILRLK